MANQGKPFYFINSFWGPQFREHFLRLSVGSLIAPGNAEAISDLEGSKYLICTTQEDWDAIQDDPTFLKLAEVIEPVFIELRRPLPGFLRPLYAEKLRRAGQPVPQTEEDWAAVTVTPTDTVMPEAYRQLEQIAQDLNFPLTVHQHYALRIFFMSNGHKQGAMRAFADGACAVFLGADLIMSDGAVAELERIVATGKKVVLTATLRFAQEPCLDILGQRGLLAPGARLAMTPRDMVKTMFPHEHPETASFEFDSPYFCDTATSSSWRVEGDAGILLHNLNYYPLLVDYEGVETHHAEYFDEGGTIDGRYIDMHFDPMADIEVIDDSDRLMLVSFTPGGEYYYPVATDILKRLPGVAVAYKTYLIRKTLNSPMGDGVKRHFYRRALKLHSEDLSPAWDKVERRAARVARNATQRFSPLDPAFALYQKGLALWRTARAERRSIVAVLARVVAAKVRHGALALISRLPPRHIAVLKKIMGK